MRVRNKKTAISVMLFCSLQMSMLCISSVITKLCETFPQYTTAKIQFLATLPDLMIVVMAVLCARVITDVDKRKMAAVSGTLFIVSALGGYLYHGSYIVLSVWSVTIGTAIGILIPTVMAVINQEFEAEEKTRMLGMQNFAVGAGGIAVIVISGILADQGWHNSYLIYLLVIPGMMGMILSIRKSKAEKRTIRNKIKVNWKQTLFYSLVVFLFFSLYNALPTNISDILVEKSYNGTVLSSIAISALLGGCAIAGLLFDHLYQRIGVYTIIVGLMFLLTGILIILFAADYLVIVSGMVIAGTSLSLVMATATAVLMRNSDAASANMAVSIMLASSDCGGFFSPVYTVAENVIAGNGSVTGRLSMIAIVTAGMILCFVCVKTGSIVKKRIHFL